MTKQRTATPLVRLNHHLEKGRGPVNNNPLGSMPDFGFRPSPARVRKINANGEDVFDPTDDCDDTDPENDCDD